MARTLPAYVVSALVIAVLAWYYFVYRAFPLNVSFTNAVVAFSATILITLSFALGPIVHLTPRLEYGRAYRKDFGLIGYALAALHSLLAAWAVMDEAEAIAYSDAVSVVFAGVAFMIFTLMALTSTGAWVRGIGYENWKRLQRTGYLALVFTLVHVALLGQGVFLERIVGQIAIGFILVVLLVRSIVLLLQLRERTAARNGKQPAGAG